MAPRRRSRVGNTRRDAALDAMRVIGFPDDLVRQTLNELLKVYGQDGWAFIEADSYKVLIDGLLEPSEDQPDGDQNQNNAVVMEHDLDEPQGLFVDNLDEVAMESAVEPEIGGDDIPVQEMVAQMQTEEEEPAVQNRVGREVSVPAVTLPTRTTRVSDRSSTGAGNRSTTGAGNEPRRTHVSGHSTTGSGNRSTTGAGNEPRRTHVSGHSTTGAGEESRQKHVSDGSTSGAGKKPGRKPCFGWISSDDEDEDEVMSTDQ